MKKPASKVAEPAQIQPKSQILFHKNLPPRYLSIMTLPGVLGGKKTLFQKTSKQKNEFFDLLLFPRPCLTKNSGILETLSETPQLCTNRYCQTVYIAAC